MKHKILLSALLVIIILFNLNSCQKSLNENYNPPTDNIDSTDTTTNPHCDTTIIGADTCIRCNDTCVKCADICEVDTTKPFVLYMNLNGSDNNSGLTEDSPLATLNGVQAKLKMYNPIHQDIEIRIKFIDYQPYTKQAIDWTYTSSIHTISFMPSDFKYGDGIDDISGRPTFDGKGTQDYFFYVETHTPAKTNLRFYYIKIKNYTEGGLNFADIKKMINGMGITQSTVVISIR